MELKTESSCWEVTVIATVAGGEFNCGGTPVKLWCRCPKARSGRTETSSEVQKAHLMLIFCESGNSCYHGEHRKHPRKTVQKSLAEMRFLMWPVMFSINVGALFSTFLYKNCLGSNLLLFVSFSLEVYLDCNHWHACETLPSCQIIHWLKLIMRSLTNESNLI